MARPTAAQGQLFEPDPPLTRRIRRGTDQTIRELRKLQRIEPVDAALVAMVRTLADLIEHELGAAEPNKWTIARLAGEWRIVAAELRGQADAGWDRQLAAFFDDPAEADHGARPVRDTPQL